MHQPRGGPAVLATSPPTAQEMPFWREGAEGIRTTASENHDATDSSVSPGCLLRSWHCGPGNETIPALGGPVRPVGDASCTLEPQPSIYSADFSQSTYYVPGVSTPRPCLRGGEKHSLPCVIYKAPTVCWHWAHVFDRATGKCVSACEHWGPERLPSSLRTCQVLQERRHLQIHTKVSKGLVAVCPG